MTHASDTPDGQANITRERSTFARAIDADQSASPHDTSNGGTRNMNNPNDMNRQRLTEILDTMDIPATRRDLAKASNVRWLQRNLAVRNNKHTLFTEARTLLTNEAKLARANAAARRAAAPKQAGTRRPSWSDIEREAN
jgi:hypothetical protein